MNHTAVIRALIFFAIGHILKILTSRQSLLPFIIPPWSFFIIFWVVIFMFTSGSEFRSVFDIRKLLKLPILRIRGLIRRFQLRNHLNPYEFHASQVVAFLGCWKYGNGPLSRLPRDVVKIIVRKIPVDLTRIWVTTDSVDGSVVEWTLSSARWVRRERFIWNGNVLRNFHCTIPPCRDCFGPSTLGNMRCYGHHKSYHSGYTLSDLYVFPNSSNRTFILPPVQDVEWWGRE